VWRQSCITGFSRPTGISFASVAFAKAASIARRSTFLHPSRTPHRGVAIARALRGGLNFFDYYLAKRNDLIDV
jgi:hypothetical protein